MAETGNFVPPDNVDSNVVNLLVKEMGKKKRKRRGKVFSRRC